MSVRILIADDHNLLRVGLRALLTKIPEFEIIGEASNGHEAVEKARRLCPDLVLLDLAMPGCDGIEATQILHAELPDIRILILTAHEDAELLRKAISEGASGYVVKSAVETELASALSAVLRGDLYVHPRMTRALVSVALATPEKNPRSEEVLTEREQEVLGLIAQGYTNTQVAEKLCLAVRTIESHRWHLMQKLDLHTRSDLVRYAIEHGHLAKKG